MILKAQAVVKADPTDRGGWRYTPQSSDADLSVTGWQVMALKAAKTAGLEVPAAAIETAADYVWNRRGDPGFAYTGRGTSYSMTGVGVACLCAAFFLVALRSVRAQRN